MRKFQAVLEILKMFVKNFWQGRADRVVVIHFFIFLFIIMLSNLKHNVLKGEDQRFKIKVFL